MTIVYDARPDGSLALYIDGDLQFDSRDEALYHELLALPALALAESRRLRGGLRALICGGGDMFAARELLKSPRIAHIDLVDYDPQIVNLARTVWPDLAGNVFADRRLEIHVEDAVVFAERALGRGERYDLIICDFTSPRELAGARLHSIEWYEGLRALLEPTGIIAANAASPSQAPDGYWSIYNSLRAAELYPRPFRFALPSFATHDYGDDWGFVIGGRKPLRPREFDTLRFAEPRRFLEDSEQLKRCFCFPSAIAARRASAPPTRIGSEWLLQALFNPTWEHGAGTDWDGLAWSFDDAPLPEPDTGGTLIPPTVGAALRANQAVNADTVVNELVELMPALRAEQTRTMVREFIANPERFLRALDLRALVEALLRRAAELPRRMVAELRLLRAELRRAWANPHSLLNRGLRIVSIIALVVILSNIIHPDTTYGKGSTGSPGGSGAYSPSTSPFMRSNTPYQVVPAPPRQVSNRGFGMPTFGRGVVVDEDGTYFPTRRYVYYRSYYGNNGYRSYDDRDELEDPNADEALYRLTPETDLLSNGEVVIALTDQAYLLLASDVTTVVETETGLPLLFLERDEALAWRTRQELTRQHTGLRDSVQAKREWMDWMSWMGFSPWRDSDERELANMTTTVEVIAKAATGLGNLPEQAPALPQAPQPGWYQLFSGVWVHPTGVMAALELPEGRVAYLDREGWYDDMERTQPRSEPYPDGFRTKALVPFLNKLTTDHNATLRGIDADLTSARSDLSLLQRDKSEYTAIKTRYGANDIVEYGTSDITVTQALQLTEDDIKRTEQLISVLETQKQNLPGQHVANMALLRELR